MDSAPKRLQIIEEEETLEQNQGFRRSSIKIMDDGSDKFFEDTSTNQGTTKYLPRLYIDQDSGIIKMGEQVLWSTWLGPLWIPVFFFLSDYLEILCSTKIRRENGPLSSLMHPDKNVMYQSVIYLSPKDYHRFHSPVDWVVKKRRHVPGQLLSVNPESYWVSSLHSNERVVYLGEWEHGFFSLSAVGATNVGSIRCDFDPDLLTNERSFKRRRKPIPDEIHLNSINFIKGQEFGYFNFGSTIVLLFEAPKEKFDFRRISKNTTIRVGQRL
ncbi:psd [Lepeophtheirus salmonis]|uniref:phosphatidylserine decarboxylase n=1 Tax=Lepeophtheirus salmonis TaxID=72036 RepID=A0A7R8CQQ2_LEPSM|nr:psd [Lepeophtheirus salmonis]CAF2848818.1 psd [Lepeophtheirus salmonis]